MVRESAEFVYDELSSDDDDEVSVDSLGFEHDDYENLKEEVLRML